MAKQISKKTNKKPLTEEKEIITHKEAIVNIPGIKKEKKKVEKITLSDLMPKEPEPVPKEPISLEPIDIDEIIFKNGENILKIVLRKKHNRMYRIQIYLNDSEIRPMTYTGSVTALNYWTLLKNSLIQIKQKG